MKNKLRLSSLGKTWILDIDGTIVKHNGYKTDGIDMFLPGAEQFLKSLPQNDKIIFITSRDIAYKETTESFLRENGIRFDAIIYGLPYGERILINDKKPSGLKTSVAINTERDVFMEYDFEIDENL